MLRNSFLVGSLLFMMVSGAFGQHGNEWINFNQNYYKLTVAEDGWYQVSAAELEAVGFPTDLVAAERLRLFRHGQEISMLVSSQGGRLTNLQFYGERNDGTLDADIYATPDAQPHSYYPLFSDSTTYFLTYSNTGEEGLRVSFSTDNDNSGLIPESYHLGENHTLRTERYSGGVEFSSANLTLPQYDNGEGWTGSLVPKNSSQDFNLVLANTEPTGPNPTIEIVMTGGNNLQHGIDVLVGSDESNLRTLASVSFTGKTSFTYTESLEWSDVGSDGSLLIRLNVTGFPDQADQVSFGSVKINYAESFNYDNTTSSQLFRLAENAANRSYLRIGSSNPDVLRFFDITDPGSPVRLNANPINSQNRADVVVTGTNLSKTILAVNENMSVPSIQSYRFAEIDLTDANYVIISHPDLRNGSNGTDPVANYELYRESEAGGSYNVVVTNVQDVYDQFTFGYPSPLAIRKMVAYGIEQGNLQFLFLIGKGLTVNTNYHRNSEVFKANGTKHFIPGFGFPGSDLLYVSGISDPFDPSIAIGRITAISPDEVQAYLNKMIEHESLAFDNLWRKRILQLSGGQNAGELNLFASYVRGFATAAENGLLGGEAKNVSKSTTETVEFVNINSEVDQGVGMITFFGHSGPAVTDIEVGDVETYNNQGRYPSVFLVNGCNAGEIFAGGRSFGEPWVLTANKGSMSFIAHSDLAFASNLRTYSQLFYELAYNDTATFGNSVGELVSELGRRYFDNAQDRGSQSQVYGMVLQSDPALEVFAAEFPDYNLSSEKIEAHALLGDQILASQDSFRIEFVVENFGRTTQDSLEVNINHTLPDGSQKTIFNKYAPVAFQDTLSFYVVLEIGEQVVGNHLFDFNLDPNQVIQEISDINNQASLEVFVASGTTFVLDPILDAIVNRESVSLKWQPIDLTESGRTYEVQIDTVSNYSSGFFQQNSVSGEELITFQLDLSSVPDSTTVFWRTRFENQSDELDALWTESSFTIIRNENAGGWGYFNTEQFLQSSLDQIDFNTTNNQWEFEQNFESFEVLTFGADHPTLNTTGTEPLNQQMIVNGVDLITTGLLSGPNCSRNSINAVVFNRINANPYLPLTAPLCGRVPERVYNFTEDDVVGANRWLEQLIDAMETNDQILLFNIGSVNFSNWDSQLRTKLEEVGISSALITGLVEGQAVIFFGTKGAETSSAVFRITNNTTQPITEQEIELKAQSTGTFNSATLLTPYIGPASNWKSIDLDFQTERGDEVTVEVIGLNNNGVETSLINNAAKGEPEKSRPEVSAIDLTGIDASTYSAIRMRLTVTDEEGFTPAQPRYFQASYDLPPDGLLLFPNRNPVKLQEGDSIRSTFYFFNHSQQAFEDSIEITTNLRNTIDGSVITISDLIEGPSPGDSTRYDLIEGTRGKVGNFNLTIQAEPRSSELYRLNNSLSVSNLIEVKEDELNPILDVTFDGSYILNGDIVSPNPLINIIMRDHEAILRKSDTVGMQVSLRTGNEGAFNRVPFDGETLSFTPATEEEDFSMLYRPGPLEDGRYSLRVRASDESGNRASENDYEISFEVINESSITHFYPYPNPFSTSTRFVFTLTGIEVPDEIKIQIMTVTGRVVREILQDEIGAIRIGNNITEYAWDGRDEYGNLLANGVYFYRVITNIRGESIQNRSTEADHQAFQNGYGKLYILR